MSLDVEMPDPPALRGPQDPGEYDAVDVPEDEAGGTHRREELAEFLRDGAWESAFEEWSEHTYLTEAEYRVALDLGLVDSFDFYWNRSAEDVGYRAPSIPDDLPEAYEETLEADDIEIIEEELDALGRTVSEVLENDYIHRDGNEFGYSWE